VSRVVSAYSYAGVMFEPLFCEKNRKGSKGKEKQTKRVINRLNQLWNPKPASSV